MCVFFSPQRENERMKASDSCLLYLYFLSVINYRSDTRHGKRNWKRDIYGKKGANQINICMEKEVLFSNKIWMVRDLWTCKKKEKEKKNRCEFIVVIVLDSLHIKFKRKSVSFHATFKTFSRKLQNTIFL